MNSGLSESLITCPSSSTLTWHFCKPIPAIPESFTRKNNTVDRRNKQAMLRSQALSRYPAPSRFMVSATAGGSGKAEGFAGGGWANHRHALADATHPCDIR
jgi:hypothetical protein